MTVVEVEYENNDPSVLDIAELLIESTDPNQPQYSMILSANECL